MVEAVRRSFPQPFQSATLAPGEEKIVYQQIIPLNWVGFVDKIANTFDPTLNLSIFLTIDSTTEPIKRQFGPINEPYKLPEPYIAETKIEWRVKNLSGVEVLFEVVTDGYLIQRRSLRADQPMKPSISSAL